MRFLSREVFLFNPLPSAYLPHRHPFLLLDRITALQPGQSGEALVQLSCNSPFPQLLLVECVAQLAGIVAAREAGEGGFLAAIQKAVFGRMPLAGDSLFVSAGITAAFGRLVQAQGSVLCCDEELLKVEMTLGIGMV